jgi:hypothetical protein
VGLPQPDDVLTGLAHRYKLPAAAKAVTSTSYAKIDHLSQNALDQVSACRDPRAPGRRWAVALGGLASALG